MKIRSFVLFAAAPIVAAFAALTGCASYPNLEADHWVHDGHYGPVTTHYEATLITRVGDGFHIATYTGAITVLGGYGVSDTINGLTIKPTAPATPAAGSVNVAAKP